MVFSFGRWLNPKPLMCQFMCIDVRIIAIFKTSRVDHISTRKYSCRSIFHSGIQESRTGICLYTFQGYFTLFPFQKIKHSNRITVAGSNLAASLCSKYNSNSVPHLVFRVLIKFTYRQHQQVRTHGFCIWYCHRNILPLSFYRLAFRLKLPGTPD
jgi:hypothetical protein